jgi:hypothetical protein
VHSNTVPPPIMDIPLQTINLLWSVCLSCLFVQTWR